MTHPDVVARPPGRPRCADRDVAILDAAMVEYAIHGFAAMSVDAVAARAGVSKNTIYRRYESKLELCAAAMYASAERKVAPDTGSLEGDLRALLHNLAYGVYGDPVIGAGIRHMVADGPAAPELQAVHDEFLQHRREIWKQALVRAGERGELPRELDLEVAVDQLTGPVGMRHLMTHMPVDDAFLEQVLDGFLRAHGAR
jgi:AcrR family transcriptional regulator